MKVYRITGDRWPMTMIVRNPHFRLLIFAPKQQMETAFDPAQLAKAEWFKKLHEGPDLLVMPNPWDAGSAKILEDAGFQALATTSAGLAFSLGKPDGRGGVTQKETLDNAKAIVQATRLPVSADMENGFGDEPQACADTVLLAAAAGLVGCSIEDNTGHSDDPIYPFDLAIERIKAAVKAARNLPFPFMLTARAENLIYGRMDLKDTIRRLVAFADAGADVLYAPGLRTLGEIETVVRAVAPKPINVLVGMEGISLEEIEKLGVKRVSIGSALARAAYGGFRDAAVEIATNRSFHFMKQAMPYDELNKLFDK